MLAFVQEQLNTAQATLRDIGLKRRELARQLEKLNNDLNARRSSRPRERYTATVEIDVKQAGELTIDLTYLVNSAGWGALYDLRLAEGDSPQVQLAYLGQVTQLSGEDWQDVALTLSTARPALATIKPKLQPWTISAYVPPPQAMPRARRMDVMQAVAAPAAPTIELAAGAAPEADMEAPAAQVSSAGASVTFRLAQSASIPSDGTPHKVNVAALEWSPQLDFISVPKLAEAAYRRAKIVNRSEYLLLPGQINLFVGGDYIGAAAIDRVAPNEEFELALGVDDRVVVKRELKAREVDKKLLADRRRIRAGYEIDLQNLHERPIDLEVHDQFPVAQHEQIKVRLESSDPKPDDQSEWNELEWHVALEPNEKRTLRFDFSIEYPTSMQVTGLP